MIVAPCKDCKDRVLGCHSTCEKYNAFKKEKEKLAELKKIQYENDYNIVKFRKRRYNKGVK